MLNKKEKVKNIGEIFDILYKDADCSLEFKTPFELLVATQLAAQCTDARVNLVTPALFERYPDIAAFAHADITELENLIRSTGFYRNKAKNLKACAVMLLTVFDAVVPDNMDDLLRLPGVGRKTANLILGDVFGIPGIVVDTHAGRLARRIGLTKNTDPEKVERDLLKIVPPDYQTRFCHQLVWHGRAVCPARSPKCGVCPIIDYCSFGKNSYKL
jgi:endonuclease-3